MGHIHRLSLERFVAETETGSGLARPEKSIDDMRRENLSDLVDERFTPGEGTFRQILKPELTPVQLSVIDRLVEGASDREIAREYQISRSTVARWRQFHPAFVAELNRRRERTLDAAADRLRQMTTRALLIIEERMSATDRPDLQLRAAVGLLRMLGLGVRAGQTGPLSAEDLIDQLAIAKRRHENRMVDHGDREEVVVDLARRDESARVGDDVPVT
jgi:hypothetical protein